MRLRALLLAVAVPVIASTASAREREDPFATKSGYMQFFATAMGGVGLRFNNPYRLQTSLGSDAESVSRTSSYADLGLATTLFGQPLGFQHGLALRTSIALEGVSQVVFTPSYLLWRRKGAWAGYGRAGFGVVTAPDLTWGLEAAGGAAWFFLGGIGLVAEVVGNVFYGVGTTDVATATYPVLSGQLGLIGSYEVLP
ncbi:MAG: hypothetical protein U0270_10675 [Labilithrix sp.]